MFTPKILVSHFTIDHFYDESDAHQIFATYEYKIEKITIHFPGEPWADTESPTEEATAEQYANGK